MSPNQILSARDHRSNNKRFEHLVHGALLGELMILLMSCTTLERGSVRVTACAQLIGVQKYSNSLLVPHSSTAQLSRDFQPPRTGCTSRLPDC